jgi:hypothetical protein
MRRLLVLLSAFLVVTIFATVTASAARPSFEYRVQSIWSIIRMNMFVYCGWFYPIEDLRDVPLADGRGYILGGDADDYAGGRASGGGESLISDPKAGLKLSWGDGGADPQKPEKGTPHNFQ